MDKIIAVTPTFKMYMSFKPLHGMTYNNLFFSEYALRNTVNNDFIFECLNKQEVGHI